MFYDNTKFRGDRLAIYILEDNIVQGVYLKQIIENKIIDPREQIHLHSHIEDIYEKVYLNSEMNLYFLDIDLHKEIEGGFNGSKRIREIDEYGIIVFVSSHYELALKSYKYLVNAYTFINKNDDLEIFTTEIGNCISTYNNSRTLINTSNFISIETKSNILRLDPSLICYFESIGMHKIAIYGISFYKEFYGSLSEILPLHQRFKRVHNSYIVNTDNITDIDRKNKLITTKSNNQIPISRKYYKEIKQLLK
jgi:two-component system response regulator AgrA